MRPLRRELAGAPRTGTTVNSSAVALVVWSMVGESAPAAASAELLRLPGPGRQQRRQ